MLAKTLKTRHAGAGLARTSRAERSVLTAQSKPSDSVTYQKAPLHSVETLVSELVSVPASHFELRLLFFSCSGREQEFWLVPRE